MINIFAITLVFSANAQYATRKLSKKQKAYIDSIKSVNYDYLLPIWGQGAYKQGFDIPYPVGAMINYFWMKQGLIMDNFQLGVQGQNVDVPLQPVDFIEFGNNTNTSYSINFRPDIWVFPFLNVYGLFGWGSSTTEVNLTKPVPLQSIVAQGIQTNGFGVMTGFGLGPVWVSVDGNWTWTKPDLLEKAVPARVLGIRTGKTFTFPHKPDRNIALWIGAMRVKMGSNTVGSIKMADAIPQDVWDRKDAFVAEYWDWYNNEATLPQQKIADRVLTPIIERIDARDGSTIIHYGMDKRPVQEWNMLLGGQFQLNKTWQLRAEGGLVGDRKSLLISLNYRFLL